MSHCYEGKLMSNMMYLVPFQQPENRGSEAEPRWTIGGWEVYPSAAYPGAWYCPDKPEVRACGRELVNDERPWGKSQGWDD